VARWQHRLEPAQRRLADGCHLTRDPVEMVASAGFDVVEHDSRYAKGPKPWTWMTSGKASTPHERAVMHVSLTVPTDDVRQARTIYPELEAIGYHRAFSFEAKHDPFLPWRWPPSTPPPSSWARRSPSGSPAPR
jgi:hypothetical protein